MCSKCFLEIVGKSNNCQFYLPIFLKFCGNISHKLLRPSKFLEKFLEILEWSFFRNKSGPSPLLNVAAYWMSSNTEACAKKLSQILANNTDNGGKEITLRIYVRYCRFLGEAAKGVHNKLWIIRKHYRKYYKETSARNLMEAP